MTRAVCAACGVLVLVCMVSLVHGGGGDQEMRALIAKAIKAKGDTDPKYKALTMKGAGKFYGLGDAIDFSAEWQFQGSTQMRVNMEIKVMDQNLAFAQIVNGNKGWTKFNAEVMDMSADEVAEEQNEMYAKWISSLTPLKDKAFSLAPLGEVKVDDKAALGVRVSREGKRDINLFFDKASALLVKTEHQVKDVKGGGNQEMGQETYLNDYKQFQDTKYATKVVIKREGKLYVEAVLSEVQLLESIDSSVFAKP